MQDRQARSQPVVQTLARFGGCAQCWRLTADRAGSIYASIRESRGKPIHLLQLKPGTNELVQLPVRLDKHVYSIAISPIGQELYEGTNDGRILVHRAPWADRAGEVLSTGHGYCSVAYCDDDRYVLLLAQCPVASAELACSPTTGSTFGRIT